MADKNLEQKIDALTSIVEKGFAASDRKFGAIADDIADIRDNMATKDQVLTLQTQVNSIEQQLRETRIEVRLGNLEEKVFGAPRR
jgi:prophage DNA circulation protein